MENLLADLPRTLADELVDVLAEGRRVRIERIVSTGQASPTGFWYDQDQAEWVSVLQGEAELLFAGDEEPCHMKAGDHLTIPAHRKHRVQWTSEEEPTVWLVVFYDELRT